MSPVLASRVKLKSWDESIEMVFKALGNIQAVLNSER